MTQISYHNDPALKEKYLKLARFHRAADQIVQRTYWEADGTFTDVPGVGVVPNGRGCAVGCVVHSDDHAEMAALLGIPEWLVRVNDAIFEGLPADRAADWPVSFLEAIPVGANLATVWNEFAIFICSFVRPFASDDVPIDAIIDLHRRVLADDEPAGTEWAAAWAAAAAAAGAAARAAARPAAWAAARAAAAAAARAVAWAAAWDARAAAWDAAEAAAWDAAGDAAWAAWAAARAAAEAAAGAAARAAAGDAAFERIADQLVALLEAVPVGEPMETIR